MSEHGQAVISEFKAALGLFATGITVITARRGDLAHGMTANAFTSVSLDPLLVLVCVGRTAETHQVIAQVGSFGVSVLAAGQEPLARWFASSRRPPGMAQFRDVRWTEGPVTTAPMLADALAWLECRVHAVHEGGDHLIYIGEVVSLARGDRRDPLVYFARDYHRLAAPGGDGRDPWGSAQVPNSRSPKSPRPGTM